MFSEIPLSRSHARIDNKLRFNILLTLPEVEHWISIFVCVYVNIIGLCTHVVTDVALDYSNVLNFICNAGDQKLRSIELESESVIVLCSRIRSMHGAVTRSYRPSNARTSSLNLRRTSSMQEHRRGRCRMSKTTCNDEQEPIRVVTEK